MGLGERKGDIGTGAVGDPKKRPDNGGGQTSEAPTVNDHERQAERQQARNVWQVRSAAPT